MRKAFVPVGCGRCYECRKQKAQQWRVRLMEELKVWKYAYFITLSFAPEELEKLCEKYGLVECNAAAGKAIRNMLERYRKVHKHSLKHWFITELGHQGTERIHLHGLIFDNEQWNNERVQNLWKYGNTFTGDYCTEKTINYVIKYMLKIDKDHKDYKSEIFCSPGIGKSFVENKYNKACYKYIPGNTNETYTLNNGYKVALPIYYRNKLYTEKERDMMWTDRLNKNEIYVNGIRCTKLNTTKGQSLYKKLLKDQQVWNKKIGYGDLSREWEAKDYNVTLRMLNKEKKRYSF